MSFCTSLRNFIQIGPPSTEKITSCRFSRSQPSWIFRGPIIGSLKGPCATCYRSSIETIALNCSVFEKIAFFLHFGDRQTDKQMDSTDALSRSRCRERRVNNVFPLLAVACRLETSTVDATDLRAHACNVLDASCVSERS